MHELLPVILVRLIRKQGMGTFYNLLEDTRFNHQVAVVPGIQAICKCCLIARFFPCDSGKTKSGQTGWSNGSEIRYNGFCRKGLKGNDGFPNCVRSGRKQH